MGACRSKGLSPRNRSKAKQQKDDGKTSPRGTMDKNGPSKIIRGNPPPEGREGTEAHRRLVPSLPFACTIHLSNSGSRFGSSATATAAAPAAFNFPHRQPHKISTAPRIFALVLAFAATISSHNLVNPGCRITSCHQHIVTALRYTRHHPRTFAQLARVQRQAGKLFPS